MIMFPASLLEKFKISKEYSDWEKYPDYRLGQAFHNFAQLHKISNPEDKAYCDKLWQADNSKAVDLIVARLDEEN